MSQFTRIIASVFIMILVSAPAMAKDGTTQSTQNATTDASNQQVRAHFNTLGDEDRCLQVVSAGVNTRNSGSPTTGGTITLPAGPTAANIVWAGMYWVILGNTIPTNAVTLNGAAVSPVSLPVTVSPCWISTSAYAYFADVTTLVVPGANLVAGLDDSGLLDVAPESEGASLVVVYEASDYGACEILILDGNDVTTFAGQIIDNPLPIVCPDDLPVELTFIGGDGQLAPDDQVWNGLPVGDGDDFDNSDPPANALAVDGWDTDTWTVASGPPNTASVWATGDCVNWVATVVEVGNFSCVVNNENSSWGQIKSIYR